MKRIASIFLILVMALYVLPVSSGFLPGAEKACKYVDNNTDENKDAKKDTGKEFVPLVPVISSCKNQNPAVTILPQLSVLPVHFTVETPPPDRA